MKFDIFRQYVKIHLFNIHKGVLIVKKIDLIYNSDYENYT